MPTRRAMVALAGSVTIALVACSSDATAPTVPAATTAPATSTASTTTTPAPLESAPESIVTTTNGGDISESSDVPHTEAPANEPASSAPATAEPAAASTPLTEFPDVTVATTAEAPTLPTTITETFVDTSRPTAATAATPAATSRTIRTVIVVPTGPGPFPLIVLNHGLTGLPERLTRVSAAWADAGFIVAMPAFPLTSGDVEGAGGNAGDLTEQPGDVSFVIDSVLQMNSDAASALYQRVDAEHIGVAGHSLGAATTYGVTFNPCCRDPRIDAIVIFAGFPFGQDTNDFSLPVPALVFHGDGDTTLPIALDEDTYARMTGPRWFVTLLGGTHSTGFEDTGSKYDALVDATSTDFWTAFLLGDETATDLIGRDGAVDGLSTVRHDG